MSSQPGLPLAVLGASSDRTDDSDRWRAGPLRLRCGLWRFANRCRHWRWTGLWWGRWCSLTIPWY